MKVSTFAMIALLIATGCNEENPEGGAAPELSRDAGGEVDAGSADGGGAGQDVSADVDAQNVADVAGQADTATGVPDSSAEEDTACNCDDGLPCNGIETCDPDTGECLAGEAVVCTDGNACNGVEMCDPAAGECLAGEPVVCTDGDACNGVETCNPGTGDCLSGEAVVCTDGNACNGMETCDPQTGNCLSGEAVACTDGNACNGMETCDRETGDCLMGEPVVCTDGNACNGTETCDPETGDCLMGEPVVCTDGDPCNGFETCIRDSGQCRSEPAPACPRAPSACGQEGGVGVPQEGRVTAARAGSFRLVDAEIWEEKEALLDRLEAHPSVSPTPLSTILAEDLNRAGTRISVSGLGCFHDGFRWNSGDNGVDYWWPQGVTGSSDHSATGRYAGRDVMLVSWYHKPEEDGNADFPKGVRIAIVDHTNIRAVRYRLALLAEPVEENGRVDLVPISGRTESVHAGGIVWFGDLLYIADTSNGFRVFDMSRILRVRTGQRNHLGYDEGANEYHAYNYQYVIPQTGRYQRCEGGCCARFSYVSLDRSADPPRMIAGEYVSGVASGRLHAWTMNEENHRLWTEEGGARASAAWFVGTVKVQGAAVIDGRFYLSSSAANTGIPPSFGSFLYASGPGESLSRRRYPYLPEDLYYRTGTDALWTCTEYPAGLRGQSRYCFSFLTADVRDGCD